MIAKCSIIRVGRSPTLIGIARINTRQPLTRCVGRRHASTTTTGSPGRSTSKDAISPIAGLSDELDRIAPRFEIEPEAIEVLRGPAHFYEVLKSRILNAKTRIYLSTLYIGKTEHELIATIGTALRNNAELKVSFLSDALRGTRETPDPTTASLLAPLIVEFGSERVQIRMYHTPNLTGLRKKWIPKRINEGWGLQHMKLYGIDDEIILSGANLSNDYFTNRLDRYHLFRSKELTDYYYRIHSAVSNISFDVQPCKSDDPAGYTLVWPSKNPGRSPLEDPVGYISHASSLLTPLIAPPSRPQRPPEPSATSIYPVFQLTPLFPKSALADTSTEKPALTAVLTSLASIPTHTTFTAGYFNPSASLISLLLSSHPASQTTVIAASPYANGFYGSKGVSGLLPAAYTLLCKRFLEEVQRRQLGERVKLLEWRRGTVGVGTGWTYHAKGIWITLSSMTPEVEKDVGPCITLVGSSNYTKRSYTLDLEANALIVTGDEGLKRRLKEEQEWLREDAKAVDLDEYRRTERRVGIQVRLAMWITKLVGGAL